MKYALITAPNGFGVVRAFELGYHLVLAQYSYDPEYADFYRNAKNMGHFIMVDNGAAELGESIPFKSVIAFAQFLNADEIIMPDVLDDVEKTLHLTSKNLYTVLPKHRAMVPQGKTWDEWEYCAKRMAMLGCATICIAKRYEQLPGGRKHALKLLQDLGVLPDHNIHLLGFGKSPIDEIVAAKKQYSGIRGCDSAAPFAYAQNNVSIQTPEHYSYKWGAEFARKEVDKNVRDILTACNEDW
jgi:hypothetical protein